MQNRARTIAIEELRERIQHLEGGSVRTREALPFGVDEIDRHLPGGGLALGALHEVAGGGNGALDGAAAALFTAGIAARTAGKVFWCVTRQDLFMPGIVQAGLSNNRVVMVECRDEKGILDCFEESLRCRGVGAVIGEPGPLADDRVAPTTARRRNVRCAWHRHSPVASPRGCFRFRASDGCRDALAHLGLAVTTAAGSRHWPGPVVSRTSSLPCRRKC